MRPVAARERGGAEEGEEAQGGDRSLVVRGAALVVDYVEQF